MYFGTCTLVQIEKRSADFNNRKNEIAKKIGNLKIPLGEDYEKKQHLYWLFLLPSSRCLRPFPPRLRSSAPIATLPAVWLAPPVTVLTERVLNILIRKLV